MYSREKDSLLRDGAVGIAGAYQVETAAVLRQACIEASMHQSSVDPRGDVRATAVMPDRPVFVDAVRLAAEILESMGFPDIRFYAGGIIPKVKGEGRKDWHVDSWLWQHPSDMCREIPPQIGALFYLDDTNYDSGQLVIAPESHRRNVYAHPAYMKTKMPFPYEYPFDAKVGDIVLLDARTMHASTENVTCDNRVCLTLWFALDFENLSKETQATFARSTVPAEYRDVLGSLYIEDPGGSDLGPRVNYWPRFPLSIERIRALLHGKTDREIILAPVASDTWIDKYYIYPWYRAIGCATAPRLILELGVRYGYSAVALITGCNWAGVRPTYVGVDGHIDGVDSNSYALGYLNTMDCNSAVLQADTRNVADVCAKIGQLELGLYDLVHVDADHSPEGIINEIRIAKNFVKPDGVILIDDLDTPHVRRAADEFCATLGITPIEIPTHHGLYLVDMAKRTIYE